MLGLALAYSCWPQTKNLRPRQEDDYGSICSHDDMGSARQTFSCAGPRRQNLARDNPYQWTDCETSSQDLDFDAEGAVEYAASVFSL